MTNVSLGVATVVGTTVRGVANSGNLSSLEVRVTVSKAMNGAYDIASLGLQTSEVLK